MTQLFTTRQLTDTPVKIAKTIKEVINQYSNLNIPYTALLEDYLAVLNKGDYLKDALNPWQVYNRGIAKREIESGISVAETAFNFAAMKLTRQKPTDVINALFYANKKRNDSPIENYVLDIFLSFLSTSDNIAVINPSPNIILAINESGYNRCTYVVTDNTVAEIYSHQFPDSVFWILNEISKISNIDKLLIINRDQPASNYYKLASAINCCNDSADILMLCPNAWIENLSHGVADIISNSCASIKQVLVLPTSCSNSSPRKKIIAYLNKDKATDTLSDLYLSVYDIKEHILSISSKSYKISTTKFLLSKKSIISVIHSNDKENKSVEKYNKSERYIFSDEISIYYRIYSSRKDKYAGVVFYKKILSVNPLKYGKTISPQMERGLRSDSIENVKSRLNAIVFEDELYSIIKTDIINSFIANNKAISLKSIWYLCFDFLKIKKKYSHEVLNNLFNNPANANVSNYIPGVESGTTLIKYIANSLEILPDDIPPEIIIQLIIVLDCAKDHKYILDNPISAYAQQYSTRATERQQDVRNALVKKHFSNVEEDRIIKYLLKITSSNHQQLPKCVADSKYLAVIIRMFTGLTTREVTPLLWSDYIYISEYNIHYISITKYADAKDKVKSYVHDKKWKKLRSIPVPKILENILDARFDYLKTMGLNSDYIMTMPIVIKNEIHEGLDLLPPVSTCPARLITAACNKVIKEAAIPEQIILLPDDYNDIATDIYRLHGDILLSNYKYKANHIAQLTNGELNYTLGIKAPDTFSEYYCDYANHAVLYQIALKLRRWTYSYEEDENAYNQSSMITYQSNCNIELYGGNGKVASATFIMQNSSTQCSIDINCNHGYDINITNYGGKNGNYGN